MDIFFFFLLNIPLFINLAEFFFLSSFVFFSYKNSIHFFNKIQFSWSFSLIKKIKECFFAFFASLPRFLRSNPLLAVKNPLASHPSLAKQGREGRFLKRRQIEPPPGVRVRKGRQARTLISEKFNLCDAKQRGVSKTEGF